MSVALEGIAPEDVLSLEKIEYKKPASAYLFFKRFFDLLFAIIAVIILSPLMLIVAIAIKLEDGGPVIHNRMCVKADGSLYKMHKFRSMKTDADSLEKWLSPDEIKQFYAEAKIENDPRITRCGKIIRKLSIDELPQLINILKGDMSIVGPRPHMVAHTEEYSALIDKYMVRHWVRPGITGWAQVNGARGETKELWQMEDRIKKDVWYVQNWSFSLDIKIIFLTVWNVIGGDKQAY